MNGNIYAPTAFSLGKEPMVQFEQGTGWSPEMLLAFWGKASLSPLPEKGRFVGRPARGLVIPAVARQILRLRRPAAVKTCNPINLPEACTVSGHSRKTCHES